MEGRMEGTGGAEELMDDQKGMEWNGMDLNGLEWNIWNVTFEAGFTHED